MQFELSCLIFPKKKSQFAAFRLQSALQFLLFNLDTFYRVCDELYYSKFSFFITLTLYCPFASWIAGGQKVSCKKEFTFEWDATFPYRK